MSYPPAPWMLKGYAVQTLQLVDIERARPFVPPQLHIVPVLPGKTLGVVYLANYGPGSVLEYHELIVVPALTRLGKYFGFWISHIYVDDPDSMAGGREIWGLPKELAQFTWELDEKGEVTVQQAERLLCTLRCGSRRSLPRLPIFLPAISLLDTSFLWFKGNITCRLGLTRGTVEVPATSPFAALNMARTGLTYHLQDMRFVASRPRVIGERAVVVRAQ